MYLWIAADVSKALQQLRQTAKLRNPGLSEIAFTLPQHISLKISFSISPELANKAIDHITDLLRDQPPLAVRFNRIEQNGDILWLRADNALLELHNQLDHMLQKNFNIPQHPFDKEFKFHSTLFIDNDHEKLRAVAKNLTVYPTVVTVTDYIIGASDDGTAGSYRILKNIRIRSQFKRKRLEGYDYSSPGSYFITVCSANKQPLFWKGNHLSIIGTIIDNQVNKLTSIYPQLHVDKYAIMPDHLHLLVSITDENAPAIPRIIQQFKGAVTKQIGHPIWQKSYFDHVIRNQADYNEKWTYIDNNPKKYLLRNE